MVDRENFPQALQIARESAGLTQSELGIRLGRTQQAVAMWESGSSFPSKKSMDALRQVLPGLAPQKIGSAAAESPYIMHDTSRKVFEPTDRAIRAVRFNAAQEPRFRTLEVIREVVTELPEHLQRNVERLRTIDYFSDKLAVEMTVMSPALRPLPVAITSKLWRLSSMRLQLEESERKYGILAIALDSEPYALQSRALAKITYEASLHGLFVKVVVSPQEAAAFITAVENNEVAVLSDFIGEDEDTDDT